MSTLGAASIRWERDSGSVMTPNVTLDGNNTVSVLSFDAVQVC